MISEALAHSPLKRFSHDEVAFTGDGIPRDAAGKPLDWVASLNSQEHTENPAAWGHETFVAADNGRYFTVLEKPSKTAPQPTEFIFEPIFPRAALSLVAGDSGCGKSTFCSWLEARATRGELTGKPLRVLVYANEDSKDEISAAYQANGADIEQIRIVYNRDKETNELLPFGAKDLETIAITARAWQPDIIRIDPLHRLADGDYNAGKTANFLDDLNLIAQNTNAAVIGVMHTKKGANYAKEAISGTAMWVAKCRSAAVLACDENDNDTAVLQHIKSNLSARQNFEITFARSAIEYADGSSRDKRIVSEVTPTDRTVDEIYAQNYANRSAFVDTDELGDLAKWVFETVKTRGGHMFAKDLFNMAKNNPSQWSTQQVRRSFRQINAATTKSLEFPPRSIVYLKSECSESEAQTWGSPANATE